MLGRRDYDISYAWPTNIANQQLESNTAQSISASKSQFHPHPFQVSPIDNEEFHLSSQQKLALDIILHHHSQQAGTIPLRMIVQGTTDTRKSFLIHCIRQKLNVSVGIQGNPLLVLAPTCVAAYNIQGTTLHASLQIPIKEMHPLTSRASFTFQEHFRHVKYILIDEMRFLGPKLLLKIDNHLRQTFSDKQHESFGILSIILAGDLGQLPPVMDKLIYASHSTTLSLWHSFKIVVTLDTIFRHQGLSIEQHHFRSLLQNIRDAQFNKHDW
ncbi:ATP-dependent DNA helicase pfh1-like [Cryptomeria japonica]|uniref:ATP-dependent DNA helicase pfh1-like n=1 Tax=Cryptomeria japonica TaxID=3369 RepID=UPI0027D9FBE5|nr:ATP-dependent DNA helicase pfh1-like [Cryptomeria japonica]